MAGEESGQTEVAHPAIRRLIQWAGLAALILLLTTNAFMVAIEIALIVLGSASIDWLTYVAASDRYWTGDLYTAAEWWYGWRYSPVATLAFIPLAPLGVTAWHVLHVVALGGLPGRLRILALASYPFWFDVAAGNLMIFVAVCAYWALRGKSLAIGIFLALTFLIPRPLMVPVAVWLLWRRPEWRIPAACMFIAHLVAVMATGYGPAWLDAMLALGGDEIAKSINAAPSAFLGLSWMLVAVPLAVLAFRWGRPALAGLLMQPYWLPYYLLILLADPLPPRSWWIEHLTPFRQRRESGHA